MWSRPLTALLCLIWSFVPPGLLLGVHGGERSHQAVAAERMERSPTDHLLGGANAEDLQRLVERLPHELGSLEAGVSTSVQPPSAHRTGDGAVTDRFVDPLDRWLRRLRNNQSAGDIPSDSVVS